jgi:hypothetical protein
VRYASVVKRRAQIAASASAILFAAAACTPNSAPPAVRAEPVAVPVWRRGEDRARIVAAGVPDRPLDVSALGWSGLTSEDGIDAELVRVATGDDLAKLPDTAVRGKIVFVDSLMRRTPDGSGYGEAVPRSRPAPCVCDWS